MLGITAENTYALLRLPWHYLTPLVPVEALIYIYGIWQMLFSKGNNIGLY